MKASDHSHQPTANDDTALDGSGPIETVPLGRVIDAFAKAPIPNPDGQNGIKLHILWVKQPVIPETPALPPDWDNGQRIATQLCLGSVRHPQESLLSGADRRTEHPSALLHFCASARRQWSGSHEWLLKIDSRLRLHCLPG
jgi:hypothetical protein